MEFQVGMFFETGATASIRLGQGFLPVPVMPLPCCWQSLAMNILLLILPVLPP